MSRILIIEDDVSLATALSDGLRHEGHTTLLARDGEAGLRLAGRDGVDLVLLDLILPALDGLEVCRMLRAKGSSVPIVVLTARTGELDKVVGLRAGADDYVTKPFSFMELVARVDAVLRRSRRPAARNRSHVFGDITMNLRTHEVAKGGKPLTLLRRELRLLQYFIDHRGEVVSRDQLLHAVWGHDVASPPLTRTVDVHVAKLRRKIEDDASDPRWIVTVHRIGYRFTG